MRSYKLDRASISRLAGERTDLLTGGEYFEDKGTRTYTFLLMGAPKAAQPLGLRVQLVRDEHAGVHRVAVLAAPIRRPTPPPVEAEIQLPLEQYPTPVSADPVAVQMALDEVETYTEEDR